jgi:hypothetical protein
MGTTALSLQWPSSVSAELVHHLMVETSSRLRSAASSAAVRGLTLCPMFALAPRVLEPSGGITVCPSDRVEDFEHNPPILKLGRGDVVTLAAQAAGTVWRHRRDVGA